MDLLSIRAVAQRMVIVVVGLVVDHTELVLAAHITQAVVIEWERVRPLTVAIWHGFLHFLAPTVKIWIEKPMPRKEGNHRSASNRHDPPVVVRGRIPCPSVKPLLVEEVCERRVSLILQEDRVT